MTSLGYTGAIGLRLAAPTCRCPVTLRPPCGTASRRKASSPARAGPQLGAAGELRHPGRRELGALRRECRISKNEYYAARLAPFANHTLALAAALRKANAAGEVDTALALDALEQSDNNGRATDSDTALATLNGLVDRGLLKRRGTLVAVAVRSMADYLADELQRSIAAQAAAARKLLAAVR